MGVGYICVVGYMLNEETKSRKAVKSEYFVSILSSHEQTQFLNFLEGVEWVSGGEVLLVFLEDGAKLSSKFLLFTII